MCLLGHSVEYLSPRIDANEIHPTADKLATITDAPVPQNLKELQSYQGLVNYYGNFFHIGLLRYTP